VGRRYGLGGPWVLRGVDLDLRPGTFVRVQGANGSGKSTLLRLLAGIDSPSEGRITGRSRTAYVPERFPAALPFTAAGYLTHLGRIHGLGRRAAATGAAEWLERFGAAAYARTPLGELSKGTSQKVAVAQALLAGPELLVLDEAWTGLDTPAREQLDLAVAELVTAGASVVHVDHDPRRPAGAADAVFLVRDGRVEELPAEGPSCDGREPVRWARIVAVGPPGAPPPDALPGDPEHIAGEDGGTVFTVPAGHSDALLRALLTARPPWHIRHLEGAEEPAANASAAAATTAATAHPTAHPTGTGTTA
jgi:ABC-type Mn2+/Zn2+ transport system ATPase subunit